MRFSRLVFLAVLPLLGCPAPEPADRAASGGDCSAPAEAAPQAVSVPAAPAGPGEVLRVVTFNIHSGLGPGFALSQSRDAVTRNLDGIAAAIAATGAPPDVIGLNEVDFPARRSGGLDQAHYLAQALSRLSEGRYEVVYGETWSRHSPGREVRFGNAALVRHPLRHRAACLYDAPHACGGRPMDMQAPVQQAGNILGRLLREPRGLIRLTLDFHGRPLDVVVTHLEAFVREDREAQAAHLLHRFVDPARTTVVLGDFNTVPADVESGRIFFAVDRTHALLTSGALADARIVHAARSGARNLAAMATYPAAHPTWPLDGVLGSLDLLPLDVKVVRSQHSDHHGLYVTYRVLHDAAVVAARRVRHEAARRSAGAHRADCDEPARAAQRGSPPQTG